MLVVGDRGIRCIFYEDLGGRRGVLIGFHDVAASPAADAAAAFGHACSSLLLLRLVRWLPLLLLTKIED